MTRTIEQRRGRVPCRKSQTDRSIERRRITVHCPRNPQIFSLRCRTRPRNLSSHHARLTKCCQMHPCRPSADLASRAAVVLQIPPPFGVGRTRMIEQRRGRVPCRKSQTDSSIERRRITVHCPRNPQILSFRSRTRRRNLSSHHTLLTKCCQMHPCRAICRSRFSRAVVLQIPPPFGVGRTRVIRITVSADCISSTPRASGHEAGRLPRNH